MRIEKVTIGISETINTGNYSNVKPSVEVTAVLEEGENLDDVNKALYNVVREHYLVNLIKMLRDATSRERFSGSAEDWVVEELKEIIRKRDEAAGKNGTHRKLRMGQSKS